MDLQLSEEITKATPDWPANEKTGRGKGKEGSKCNFINLPKLEIQQCAEPSGKISD